MENVDIVGIVKRAKPKKIYSVSDLIEFKKQQEFIQKTTILDLESKKAVINTIEFIQKLVFSNSMIIDDNQTERQLIRQYQRFDNWSNIVDAAIKNEITTESTIYDIPSALAVKNYVNESFNALQGNLDEVSALVGGAQ